MALRPPAAITWRGRRGKVLLGPTEDRVARYLDHLTRHGRVTVRTVDVGAALSLERSETYRITARLRVLGLFGIENDRGGVNGGRRYWRTPTEHDGARLDAVRHRRAWTRVWAWARARSDGRARRLAEIRNHTRQGDPGMCPLPTPAPGSAPDLPGAGGNFYDLMRRAGLGALLDSWGVTS